MIAFVIVALRAQKKYDLTTYRNFFTNVVKWTNYSSFYIKKIKRINDRKECKHLSLPNEEKKDGWRLIATAYIYEMISPVKITASGSSRSPISFERVVIVTPSSAMVNEKPSWTTAFWMSTTTLPGSEALSVWAPKYTVHCWKLETGFYKTNCNWRMYLPEFTKFKN